MAEVMQLPDISLSSIEWNAWRVPQKDLLLMAVQVAPSDIVIGYMRRSAAATIGVRDDEPFVYDDPEFGFEKGLASAPLDSSHRLDGIELNVLRSHPSFGCHHSGLLICDQNVAQWPGADLAETGAYLLKVGHAKDPVDTGAGNAYRDGYVFSTVTETGSSPSERRVVPTLVVEEVTEGIRPITMQYTSEYALSAMAEDPKHNLRRAPMRLVSSADLGRVEEFCAGNQERTLSVVGVSIVACGDTPNGLVLYVEPSESVSDDSPEMVAQAARCDFEGFGSFDVRAHRLFTGPLVGPERKSGAGKWRYPEYAPPTQTRRPRKKFGGALKAPKN